MGLAELIAQRLRGLSFEKLRLVWAFVSGMR